MWPNPQFPTDLDTFAEEILNGKLHILCWVLTSFGPLTHIKPMFLFHQYPITIIQKEKELRKHLPRKCWDIGLISEAVARRCFVKKLFLEISQNSRWNTYVRVSFLIKWIATQVCNFIKKETLAQVFSCDLPITFDFPGVLLVMNMKRILMILRERDLICWKQSLLWKGKVKL